MYEWIIPSLILMTSIITSKGANTMFSNLSPSHATTRSWCWALVATLVVLLTACGSSTTGSAPATAGTTPTTSSGGRYGGGGTTPTASSSRTLIQTATATLKGTSQTILTTAQGMRLYYRTSDEPPAIVCSGGSAGAGTPPCLSGPTARASA